MNCILCKSDNVAILDQFDQKKLREYWLNFYDLDNICKDPKINLFQCRDCKLEYFDPKFAGNDDFYSELGKFDWYYNHPGKTEYDFVQKYFTDNLKVLDIGCGTGVLLSKTKANIDYTGLELSTHATNEAKSNGVNVINQTIQDFSKANSNSFDVVVSFQVLEHLTEVYSFVESAVRVLKPGGKFIIAVPNNESFICYKPNYKFNLTPHHTILWKKKQLKYLAKEFNLTIENLHNEKIQDVHLEAAQDGTRYFLVRKILFYKKRVIDFSSRHDRILKITKYFNKFRLIRISNVLLKPLYKDGQSMICVFVKK